MSGSTERDWIHETMFTPEVQQAMFACASGIIIIIDALRLAHEAHCKPLTNELAERIAAAVIEDCQQAQRVGSTATSVRTWLPTAWNIKQIILRVRSAAPGGVNQERSNSDE